MRNDETKRRSSIDGTDDEEESFRFVVSSLRVRFGFAESEAVELTRRHSWEPGDIDSWSLYFDDLIEQQQVANPKAYTARLMRQYRTPPTPPGKRSSGSASEGEKSEQVNLLILRAQELWRKGAWWIDSHGRRWEFEQYGLHCLLIGSGPTLSTERSVTKRGFCLYYLKKDTLIPRLAEICAGARLPASPLRHEGEAQ